jgi:ADP-heptose:LPS heptosyltransferase
MLLPASWRVAFVKWLVGVRFKCPQLSFPWNYSAFKKVLVILPEEPVEAVHQIKTYLGLASLIKNAGFFILCTKDVAMFFQRIHPEATFVEYEKSERYLFSDEFKALGKYFFSEEIDLCLLLERVPNDALLYLIGKTAAPFRAGYVGSAHYPFLNIQVNPLPAKEYLSDRNFMIARIFGASENPRLRWSVAKETVNEIVHMMHELNMPEAAPIIGIDAGYFFTSFGEAWTGKLIRKLKSIGTYIFYFYYEGEPDETVQRFLNSFSIPIFANITPSRCAALISKSEYTVTGKTVFFELAHLLHNPVIGIFEKKELATYCQQTSSTHGIAFDDRPDEETAQRIVDTLQKAIDQKPA